jgi:hypothetical protein
VESADFREGSDEEVDAFSVDESGDADDIHCRQESLNEDSR